MNPISALCALLTLGCSSPTHVKPMAVLGMVAGHARTVLEADWLAHEKDPAAPERLYQVTKDSTDTWQVGATDSLTVLFILEVVPVPALRATPLSIVPAIKLHGPSVHMHQTYCDPSPWGLDYSSCSGDRPEAAQCRPSFADMRTQIEEGHAYDVVMCGERSFVFYFPTGGV